MIYRPIIALAASIMLLAATTAPQHGYWHTTIVATADGGHVTGNPQAKVKLIEYISYTCPHCARLYAQSDVPITLKWVAPGQLAVEVQPFLRNNVDVTLSLLTNCGTGAKWSALHRAFLNGQEGWMKALNRASAGQQERWNKGDFSSRQRAIANDAHLYDIMERFGFARPTVDRCLANKPLAERMAKATEAAVAKGVEGTPALFINGELLKEVYDWHTLEPQLKLRIEGDKPNT